MGRRTVGALVGAVLLVTSCGGDDDADSSNDEAGADTATADDDASQTDDGSGGDANTDAPAAAAGTATVTVDGSSYVFEQVDPGPDDDYFTFCSTVAGTLQAVFPQVDEAGNVVEGELSVIFIEPGGPAADQGEPPEIMVSVDQRYWYYEEGQPIDIPADGRSASGTVTLVEAGAMNAETGEIETTPFEATIELSC